MSHQLHIVYPDLIKGVGLYAGGPFGQNFMDMEGTIGDWKDLIPQYAADGTIGDTALLKDAPVIIVGGANDPGVPIAF